MKLLLLRAGIRLRRLYGLEWLCPAGRRCANRGLKLYALAQAGGISPTTLLRQVL